MKVLHSQGNLKNKLRINYDKYYWDTKYYISYVICRDGDMQNIILWPFLRSFYIYVIASKEFFDNYDTVELVTGS